MKKALNDIGKFLLGFILFVIAIIISPIIIVWGTLEAILKAFYKRSIGFALTFLGSFFFSLAIVIDMLLNVFIQVPANRLLKYYDGYPFGKAGDTFSKALGRNKKIGNLRPLGIYICKFLHLLDKNHCEKSA